MLNRHFLALALPALEADEVFPGTYGLATEIVAYIWSCVTF